MVTLVAQVALVIAGAPLVTGLINKVRARAEGRVGPPLVQPWRDLRKLWRKESLRPRGSGLLFAAAPLVLAGSTLSAVVLTPLLSAHPLLGSDDDLVVVVFLLLIGSVSVALAGLDAGTAFGGLGASRALTIVALSEPALLVGVVALAMQSSSTNAVRIVNDTLAHPTLALAPTRLFAVAALVVVVIAETGRLPVDNSATHLELTMVHEAMVLEYSGSDLALVTWAESARLTLLVSLVVTLFVPWGLATSAGWGSLVAVLAGAAKTVVVTTGIALLEVRSAKLRLFRLPELLAGGFVLAMLAMVSGLVAR